MEVVYMKICWDNLEEVHTSDECKYSELRCN